MHIVEKITFGFTPEAQAAALSAGITDLSWPMGDLRFAPLPGDFVTFGNRAREPLFVVLNRSFNWDAPARQLAINVVLDLHAMLPPPLQVVK